MASKHTVDLPTGAAPTNPAQLAYQRAMADRKQAPKVGGDQGVKIPRLDARPDDRGGTMAEQAAPPPSMKSILDRAIPGMGPVPLPQNGPRGPGLLRLAPNDTLPEEAKNDPHFLPGMGGMLAVNQRHLAAKYGVIREGRRLTPEQLLTDADKPAMQSTQDSIKTLLDAQERAKKAAADAGEPVPGAPPPEKEPLPPGGSKILNELDYDMLRQLMTTDEINSKEQRLLIESRLEPLDLGRLLVQGSITQVVPIRPGQFEPEFETATGQDKLAIKRLIAAEARALEVPDNYLLDKHAIMAIAVGLKSINKIEFPSHRDKDGNFDDALFLKKFERITRLNTHLLASLGVNFAWFDERVRGLFVAEKIKNG